MILVQPKNALFSIFVTYLSLYVIGIYTSPSIAEYAALIEYVSPSGFNLNTKYPFGDGVYTLGTYIVSSGYVYSNSICCVVSI